MDEAVIDHLLSGDRMAVKASPNAPEMYGARLVLDGSHRNHVGEPGVWRDETHKHRWTNLHGDAIAYSLGDITAKPGAAVGADEYRAVFEAFAAECEISLTEGYNPWRHVAGHGDVLVVVTELLEHADGLVRSGGSLLAVSRRTMRNAGGASGAS